MKRKRKSKIEEKDTTKSCPNNKQSRYSKKRSGVGKSYAEGDITKLDGDNNFSWYNLNKTLIEMAARVPFGRPIGNDVSYSVFEYNSGVMGKIDKAAAVPGLATFYMHSSIGCSVDGAQTIDVAAKSIYSWVRHANSGHANYDAPDLMIYLMSCKEVYAAAGYMLKILGSINKYEGTNRYLPDAILDSLGVSAWIRSEIANFRYFCAQWFKKAQVLYTPKKFPLFEKAFWMFTQLFAEDNTGKGQLYQYVPTGFFKFNPTKYTSGGCLEYEAFNNFATFTQFTTYFTDMLDRLIDDEDMGIMSGDIKKAFDNDVWTLGDFPFEGNIEIAHDSFVLQQMHNITPFMVTDTIFTDDIVQDPVTNQLLYFPRLNRTAINDSSRHFVLYDRDEIFIDIDAQVPSTEEVIEATQYSNHIRTSSTTRIAAYYNIIGVTQQADDVYLENTADYFCERFSITQMIKGNSVVTPYTMGYYSEVQLINSAIINQLLCGCSAFEWLPKLIIDAGITAELPFWQIHNYTLIRSDVINNLHDATWLSLLAIPANEHLR